MTRCRVARGAISALTVAAIVASCGGSDSGGDSATLGSADNTTATGVDATTEGDASADVSMVTDAPTSGSDVDDSSDASGDITNCDGIFTMAEAEEFLAEPVELTEETNDSLGQLTCTWESIEDPDDLEDLGAQTLFVQFYSGSPIEGSAFIDPTIFDSVTTIDGVGDLAYTPDATPNDYYFVDGEVAGSLSYFEFNLGDSEAEPLHTTDDVEQLFRTFHERVT